VSFADAAEQHPEFSRELPRFLAAIWRTFNEFEIAGYVASRAVVIGVGAAATVPSYITSSRS
jgi:hypothetical protein